MTIKLGVVMDPIDTINYKKDSTLAMLWEAERRGWEIYYFEQSDLFLKDCVPFGRTQLMHAHEDEKAWYSFYDKTTVALADLDVILMRKDPPFDAAYIYTTYILEHAERAGALVINHPQALRDSNEKLFACDFPDCLPPSLVTQSADELQAFLAEYKDIVVKPLDAMGGNSIFRLHESSVNANVVFELQTKQGSTHVMAQRYIPEIVNGDKRVLMINGEPVPYALARVPREGDWRGNLAAGATGMVRPLTERDKYIASAVGPVLKKRGLYFVGLDIIGDYLTEINVTSPTCIREIERDSDAKICKMLFDFIAGKLKTKVSS